MAMHRSDFKITIYSSAADPNEDKAVAKLQNEIIDLMRARLRRPYRFAWHVSNNNSAVLDAFTDSLIEAR